VTKSQVEKTLRTSTDNADAGSVLLRNSYELIFRIYYFSYWQ